MGIGNRELPRLLLASITAAIFAFFSISLNLLDRFFDFFKIYSKFPIPEILINLILLWLTAVVWITYRRWREAKKGQEELEEIISSISPDALLVVDPDRKIHFCNASAKRLLGYDPGEVINQKTDLLFFDRRFQQGQGHEIFETVERDGFHTGRATGKKKNGDEIPLEIITGKLNHRPGVVLLLRDINERRQAEEALRRGEETAKRIALENSTIAEIGRIISSTLDIEQVYERFAEEVRKLIPFDRIAINIINSESAMIKSVYVAGVVVAGRQAGDAYPLVGSIGQEIMQTKRSILLQTEDQDEVVRYSPHLLTTFQAGFRSMMSVPLILRDQVIGILHIRSTKPLAYTASDVKLAETIGAQIAGAIANAQLYAEQKRVEEALKYFSLHDSLTGLYNRTYFEEEMRRIEKGRYDHVCIILCDVDGLKFINDTLGHQSGDSLLLAAAAVIKECFREGDMVARVGGDEFAVLLPNSPEVIVESSCQRIREAVVTYNAAHAELLLSISMGFAVRNEESKSMGDLFREADNNMYREKLYHSQSTRSAIVQALMKALEVRDFITQGHVDRLQKMVAIVASFIGLPEPSITDLRLLAQFHDIGKVGIPDRILFKESLLTPEEWIEMQRHCEIGHRIALSAPDLIPIADWVLKHHEWWNGQGYPIGLKGEEIPIECRILAIADAYEAMISDRPYRKAMSHEEAVAELWTSAGSQFDPELVNRFIEALEKQKAGEGKI